jgi:excisionase family DNA binding protein
MPTMNDNDARHDTTGMSHDTTPTVSVAEAAQRLGITDDAVRARIRRGTLAGEKVGAVWHIHLPTGATPEHEPARHDTTDRRATRRDPEPDALAEQLRSEVGYLREQLATTLRQLGAERERADVLQREALNRIEALSASVRVEPDDQEELRQQEAPVDSDGVWAHWRRWWNVQSRSG